MCIFCDEMSAQKMYLTQDILWIWPFFIQKISVKINTKWLFQCSDFLAKLYVNTYICFPTFNRKIITVTFANSVSVTIFIQHFMNDSRRKENLLLNIKLYSLVSEDVDIIILLGLRYTVKDRPFLPPSWIFISPGKLPSILLFCFHISC